MEVEVHPDATEARGDRDALRRWDPQDRSYFPLASQGDSSRVDALDVMQQIRQVTRAIYSGLVQTFALYDGLWKSAWTRPERSFSSPRGVKNAAIAVAYEQRQYRRGVPIANSRGLGGYCLHLQTIDVC